MIPNRICTRMWKFSNLLSFQAQMHPKGTKPNRHSAAAEI